MEDWIVSCAKLMGKWDKVAAGKALARLRRERHKSVDERLMGYALAQQLLDNVFSMYAKEKQTLSDEGRESLEIAIELARASIPPTHPLLKIFMRTVSFIEPEYSEQSDELNEQK